MGCDACKAAGVGPVGEGGDGYIQVRCTFSVDSDGLSRSREAKVRCRGMLKTI